MKQHHIRRLSVLEEPRNVTARAALTDRERAESFAKTAGTCHVCGGRAGTTWQAITLFRTVSTVKILWRITWRSAANATRSGGAIPRECSGS